MPVDRTYAASDASVRFSSPLRSGKRRTVSAPCSLPWGVLLNSLLTALLLALAGISTVNAQTYTASAGESFFIGLPWGAPADDHFLRVNITAVSQAEVTVTQTESGLREKRTLMPGEKWEYLTLRSRIILPPGERKSSRTIHVDATGPITVNVVSDGPYVTDSYCALPIETYGTEYYAVSYADTIDMAGFVAVIATQDDTQVRITPTALTAGGNDSGYTYGVTLNRGEIYQITPSNPRTADLSGTRITGDKPVVVLSGHQGTNLREPGSAQNFFIEQIPPVVDWGRRFYSLPLKGQRRAIYKVVASRPGTVIRRNGLPIATLDAGQRFVFSFEEPAIIETSEPAMLTQFTTHFDPDTTGSVPAYLKPNADPSAMIINPVESFARSYLWMTPFLIPRIYPASLHDQDPDTIRVPFVHYLLVTAPIQGRTSVRLDGRPIDFDKLALPHGDGRYVTAIVEIEPGIHRLTSSAPINAQTFGYSHYDAYSSAAGIMLRDAFRADGLMVRTCRDVIDTLIDLVNISATQIAVSGHSFTGLSGTVTNPGYYPFEVLPNSKRTIRVRIDLPNYGDTTGTLTLRTSTGTSRPLEIPIVIRRDSMAVEALEKLIDFGETSGSAIDRDTIIRVVNTGHGPLAITQTTLSGPFAVIGPQLPATIEPGDTLDIAIRFTPFNPGIFNGAVTIHSAPCAEPLTIPLSGSRVRSATIEARADTGVTLLCAAPSSREFAVTVSNSGEQVLAIDSVRIDGLHAGDFTVVSASSNLSVPPAGSLPITLRFTPSGIGARSATLRLWNSAPEANPLAVPLQARKDSAAIEASVTDIDAGLQTGCGSVISRSFTIRNRGSIAIALDSSVLSNREFTLSGPIRTTILPGDSTELTVTFAPQGSGRRFDTIRIFSSPCDLRLTIPLQGSQQAAGIAMSVDTIDFGAIPLCVGTAASEFTILNTGTSIDTVTSLEIVGSAFTIDALADSILTQGKRSAPITVRFNPGGEGKFTGTITLRADPCGMSRTIVLRGSVGTPSVDTIDDIDLGALSAGAASTGSTTVTNTSEFAVVVRSITIDPPVNELTMDAPGLPITIAPGDSVSIDFTYNSNRPFPFTTSVAVEIDSPCVIRRIFKIGGTKNIDTIAITLSFPDTTGKLNDYLRIPLYLRAPKTTEERLTIRGELRWDRRNLLYRGLTAPTGATVTVLTTGVDGNDRVVAFEYAGPVIEEGTAATLEAVALLGPQDVTPLRIASATARTDAGADATVNRIDGSFTLEGVCRPSSRLIEMMGTLRITAIVPNPAVTMATATVEIADNGRATIQVFDAVGREALRPFDGIVGPGVYEIDIDVSRLPAGIYLCRLQAGGSETRQKLIVVR